MISLTQIIVILLFIVMVIVFVISFIIMFQKRQSKYLLEKQLLQAQYEQELLRTQLDIQERTLKNISEEIHDNIGQALSLAKLNLSTVKDLQEQKFADARYLLAKAITDLRTLGRSLHGEKIAETGLAAAIENELTLLRNSGRFTTRFSVTGEPVSTPPQTEMVLFRIVQEALHNAIKHSTGNGVEVALDYTPGRLQLRIADDGMGFDPAALQSTQAGIGLKSMKNRAALAGASLSIHSQPGSGTEVALELPFTRA
jgi:signal transduction histidine kinase